MAPAFVGFTFDPQPLADAARAHKEILEPGASGKVVLLAYPEA
jgi:hypothetical protein